MSETPTVNPEGSDKQKSGSFTEARLESARKSPGFQGASTGWQQPSGALFSSGEENKVTDKQLDRARFIIAFNGILACVVAIFTTIPFFPIIGLWFEAYGVFVFLGCLLWVALVVYVAYGVIHRQVIPAILWIVFAAYKTPGIFYGTGQIDYYASDSIRFLLVLAWIINLVFVVSAIAYIKAWFTLRKQDTSEAGAMGKQPGPSSPEQELTSTVQNTFVPNKPGCAKIIVRANSYYCWFLVVVISLFVLSIGSFLGGTGIIIAVAIIVCFGLVAYGLGKRNGFAAVLWALITLFALFGVLAGSVNPDIMEDTVSTARNLGAKFAWYIFVAQVIFGTAYLWAFFVLRNHDKAKNDRSEAETETPAA